MRNGSFALVYSPHPGAAVEACMKEAVEERRWMNADFLVVHNDRPVWVRKHDTVDTLMKQWNAQGRR